MYDFYWFLLRFSMILADFWLPGSGSVSMKRIRIRLTKMKRNHTDPDPKHCIKHNETLKYHSLELTGGQIKSSRVYQVYFSSPLGGMSSLKGKNIKLWRGDGNIMTVGKKITWKRGNNPGMRIRNYFLGSGSGSAEKSDPNPTLIRNEKKYLYYRNSSPPIRIFGFIKEFSWK